jgi:uncharacterized protein (TIGR02145 family)
MKQKLFFLMLTLFVLGAASTNAQVRIGGTDTPHTSAVLDLNTTDDAGSTLGLALPRVALGALDGDDAKLNSVNAAEGTVVYNTNGSVTDGKGLYVWNGTQWIYVAAPSTYPITTVGVALDTEETASTDYIVSTIPSQADDTIFRGRPIQLKIDLTPESATADNFGWSVSGSGARINAAGVVTVTRTGTITARATSPNGIFAEKRFVVVNPRTTGSVTFPGGTYATFDYNGTVWMVENLKEGVESADIHTQYNVGGTPDGTGVAPAVGERGYYYSTAISTTVCPEGWRLPYPVEWSSLASYVTGTTSSPVEKSFWIGSAICAGQYTSTNSTWSGWNSSQLYRLINGQAGFGTMTNISSDLSYNTVVYSQIRCVQIPE